MLAVAVTATTLSTTVAIAAPTPKVVQADITLVCVTPLHVALRAAITFDAPLPTPSYALVSGTLVSPGRAPAALSGMLLATSGTTAGIVVWGSSWRVPARDSLFQWSVAYTYALNSPLVIASGTARVGAPDCPPIIGIAAVGAGRYDLIDASAAAIEFPNEWPVGQHNFFTGVAAANAVGHLPFVTDREGHILSVDRDATFGEVTKPLASPIVAMAVTPTSRGYWLVTAAGRLASFGNAQQRGSMAGRHLNHPIVAIVPTATSHGYWLVASDGGVFSYGDARFHGSTGSIRLRQPIVAAASTPTGHGYWLVASDGGVFTFGDAHFYGSAGNRRLTKPVVGIARTANGRGYWLVTSDGRVFAFGNAPFNGSLA